MAETTIVVLEGDETGQELLEEALRVLEPDVIGLESTSSASTSRSRTAARPQNQVVARGRGARSARPGSA